MSAKGTLAGLEEAKRLAVAQAAIHRTLLRLECQGMRERLNIFRRISRSGPHVPRGLLVGAALLGAFVARRPLRSLLTWVPSILSLHRWWTSRGKG